MTDYSHYSDDDLLRVLGEALTEADQVPPEVLELARAAPELYDVDAELAQLVADSHRDQDKELAGVRGDGATRQLDYASRTLDLALVLDRTTDGVELTGQVVPAVTAVVELLHLRRVVHEVEADALGRFRMSDLPDGPLRLRVRLSGRSLLTPVFLP
ncbi:MAG: hypothetical protein JWO46_3309 [Nocardioidaceae bacterium]|nr:hypothetical protein [Nocardioidaceae bacterium]